jgi:hypothetical protein
MEPVQDTRPPHRPRSAWLIVALSLGMIAFLGLVAAVSRAHHTPGSRNGIHSPPSGVGDYVFTIFFIVLVAGALFVLYVWFSERDLIVEARRGRKKNRGTYRTLIMLFVLLGLVMLLRSRFHVFEHPGRGLLSPSKVHPGHPQKAKKPPGGPGDRAHAPQFEYLPIALATAAGLVVLGFIGVRSVRRSRNELVPQYLLERELESLLDDTLDDLYATKDPRAAIIAAYARMEQLFAARGFARDPAETSMEFLARCVGELRASGAALGRLTGLFQRAKFSTHEVDSAMRDEAIEALTQVRDELRAHRQEDELRRAEAARIASERAALQSDSEKDRQFGEDPFQAAAERMRGDVYTGGR